MASSKTGLRPAIPAGGLCKKGGRAVDTQEALAKIDELRKAIDDIDSRVVRLLNERAKIVLEIKKVKEESGVPIYDARREEQIFENLRRSNEGPLFDEALREIYETVLHWMKNLENED